MPRPIEIKVTSDTSDARGDLTALNTGLSGIDAAAQPSKISNLKRLGAAIVAGGALAKGVTYLKEAALAASDMNETVSKTKQVFGKDAGGVITWAKDSDAALLGAERAVLDVVDGFALLLGNKGINGPDGLRMSQNLTNLSADLASFFNTDFESAAAAVSSALRGEMDPIERYGVTINEASLKAKAFELGLYSGKGALDANAKSQAAYALIMEQTSAAQGDVERTQGSLANQSRIFNTNLTELKTTIGDSLVPLGEAILPKVNSVLQEAIGYLGTDGFKGLVGDIAGIIKAWNPSLSDVKTTLSGVDLTTIKTDFGWLKTAADQLGAGLKTIWGAFNDLSPEAKANIATLVAAGAALKALTMTNPVIKIGVNLAGEVITTAATSLTSALFNSVVPLKVMVVNPDFDITSPTGSGRLKNVLRGFTFLGDIIAGYELATWWWGEATKHGVDKDIKDVKADIVALDNRISGLDTTDVGGVSKAQLDLEAEARRRGDRTTRSELAALSDNFSAFVGQYYRRTRTGGGAYANSGSYVTRAATTQTQVFVSDEQIARAVYDVLLRSGVRNGTQVVA
jgi:hypothetical protein